MINKLLPKSLDGSSGIIVFDIVCVETSVDTSVEVSVEVSVVSVVSVVLVGAT